MRARHLVRPVDEPELAAGTARPPGRRASTTWLLTTCLVLGLGLRLPFLARPLGSDEAGLLLVARHWAPGAHQLYGDYWVDRPPLLLASFWLADALPDGVGVRLMGCLASVILVLSAATAGHLVGGRGGAWAAGLVAAATGSSYVIVGHQANGMVQAAALTMASCTLALLALRETGRASRRHALCVAAGAVGAAAVMVKQNFLGALVFGAVVLVASAKTGRMPTARAAAALAAGLAGALGALAAVGLWAVLVGVDPDQLWYAVVQFRIDAAATIAEASMNAPLGRLTSSGRALLGSGLVLFVVLLAAGRGEVTRNRADVAPYAGIVALTAVAVLGIVLGGSWWRHYLVQLVPPAALVAALLAPRASRWGTVTRCTVAATVASAVVGAGVGIVLEASATAQVAVGRYVGAAAQPDDTAFVTWGHAEVLHHGGLTSPYPYLWSLPARVLDPDLELLVELLRGPEAPTWLIELDSFDAWGIDDHGRLADAVADRYRIVETACGAEIHLLRGQQRTLARSAAC